MRLPGQKELSYWGRAENKYHYYDTARPTLKGSVEAEVAQRRKETSMMHTICTTGTWDEPRNGTYALCSGW